MSRTILPPINSALPSMRARSASVADDFRVADDMACLPASSRGGPTPCAIVSAARTSGNPAPLSAARSGDARPLERLGHAFLAEFRRGDRVVIRLARDLGTHLAADVAAIAAGV